MAAKDPNDRDRDPWGNCFPPALRVRHADEYRRILDQGRHAADGVLVVIAARNGLSYSRLGTIVSRQVGNSVVRHRWKRLIREAFRQHRSQLPRGFDIIIKPKRDAVDDARAIAQSLGPLVHRALRKLPPAASSTPSTLPARRSPAEDSRNHT